MPTTKPELQPAESATLPFVQARHFTRVTGKPRTIELLVLHTMEAPEKPSTAEDVAAWFAGPDAPQASAHYCIDANSVVQCVLDKDVAWGAPPCNHNGLQLEHAGRARQTVGEWADAYSQRMLRRSAALAADLCARHGIPPNYVNVIGLQRGLKGITTHANVSAAFKESDHTDPGPNFPMAAFLAWIREHLAAAEPDWFTRAKTLGPLWAWMLWRDHGQPPQWRPPQVPRSVPSWWWGRYLLHKGGV
jgi:N-acetyl-anhydromuramyl-L-alanine amidase AmpD